MAKRFPLGNEWLARFRFARVSGAKDIGSGLVAVRESPSAIAWREL
jgi:hypothetical protein